MVLRESELRMVRISILAVIAAFVTQGFLLRFGDQLPKELFALRSSQALKIAEGSEEDLAPKVLSEVGAERVDPEKPRKELGEGGSEAEMAESTQGTSDTEEVVEEAEEIRPARFLPVVVHVGPFEDGVMLQGSLPTREDRDALVKAVREAMEEEETVDRLIVSPHTVRPEWLSWLPEYTKTFLEHSGGEQEVTVVDGRLSVLGKVGSEEAEESLREAAGPILSEGVIWSAELEVDPSLSSTLPSIEELAAISPVEIDPAAVETAPAVLAMRRGPSLIDSELDSKGSDLNYVGPVESPEQEQEDEPTTVAFFGPNGEREDEPLESVRETGGETEPAAAVALTRASAPDAAPKSSGPNSLAQRSGPVPDDGKPIIFYFETGSSEIADEDWEKVQRAIQRASRPRTIVYITGYADYRGSFELNHKLTLERANNVKDAIFAANLPDTVTAEIKAKADEQSEKRDPGRRDDDRSLRYNRRVVVEVYHLKG